MTHFLFILTGLRRNSTVSPMWHFWQPFSLSLHKMSHFSVSLIYHEYAFQLCTVAYDTYVSKMCGSQVIIEMIIRNFQKRRQLYLAFFSCKSSKYMLRKHRGTKCANVHLSILLCLSSFLRVCVRIFTNAKYLFACALRHSHPSVLIADSESNI